MIAVDDKVIKLWTMSGRETQSTVARAHMRSSVRSQSYAVVRSRTHRGIAAYNTTRDVALMQTFLPLPSHTGHERTDRKASFAPLLRANLRASHTHTFLPLAFLPHRVAVPPAISTRHCTRLSPIIDARLISVCTLGLACTWKRS